MAKKKRKKAEKRPLSRKFKMSLENKIYSVIFAIIVICFFIFVVIDSRRLNVESKEVTTLYSYLGYNDLKICNGLENYSDKLVNQSKISSEMKICNVYSLLNDDKLEEVKVDKTKKKKTCKIEDKIFATDNYEDDICTLTKVSVNDMKVLYYDVYGIFLEDFVDFQLNSTTVCQYSEGYYYCGLSETYTYTFGVNPVTFRSIKKAVEKGNEIIIYDYFIKVKDDKCYSSYTTEKENKKCSEKINDDLKINYRFLKKNGTLYKHVFLKNKGDKNYHWEYSEPVK